jgi:hypothetical protein
LQPNKVRPSSQFPDLADETLKFSLPLLNGALKSVTLLLVGLWRFASPKQMIYIRDLPTRRI